MTGKRPGLAAAAWMTAGTLLSGAAIAAAGGPAVTPELWFGLAAPLVSTVVSWIVIERTQRTAPEKTTGVLMAAFGIKVVLIGAYVVGALAGLSLRPVPFIVSFTGYYVLLHATEALLLKRLLAPHTEP
jgi:hypothetical protein